MENTINCESLNQLIESGAGLTLLDVRRKADLLESDRMIPGARWANPESADTWAEQLSKTHPTVVYCVKGGSVSQSVTRTLKDKGLDAVFLEGGIKAWSESGLPVMEKNIDLKTDEAI